MPTVLDPRFLLAVALAASVGCGRGMGGAPARRERAAARDAVCTEPDRPHAFFYPSHDRTQFGPDDPNQDRCRLAVPDHLFCCPAVEKPTDR